MACIVEHCEAEGGRLDINFQTQTDGKYHAKVLMCMACWQHLREHKGDCDVLYTPAYVSVVDFDFNKRMANVHSIRIH